VTLAEAYRRYAPDLYRFALRLCGERAAAEDLAAEAFALAVGGAAPPPGASVRGFLLGTVRNLHLHRRRSAARRPVAPLEPERHVEGGPGPERDAAARAELAAALRDLQALPEEARAALLLRAEGIPYDEIAAVLGTTPGAVKVRVHRARQALAAGRLARDTEGEAA